MTLDFCASVYSSLKNEDEFSLSLTGCCKSLNSPWYIVICYLLLLFAGSWGQSGKQGRDVSYSHRTYVLGKKAEGSKQLNSQLFNYICDNCNEEVQKREDIV